MQCPSDPTLDHYDMESTAIYWKLTVSGHFFFHERELQAEGMQGESPDTGKFR